MIRCTQPPVVQPVHSKPRESVGSMFFRWLRWSAVSAAMIPILIVAAVQWRTVREREMEASLKEDMLRRGMTAQEIERVLKASSNPSRAWASSQDHNYYSAKHAEIEANLIKELAAQHIAADDIERIHRAFVSSNGASPRSHASSEKASKDADFVKKLARSGRSAGEIEKLLSVTARRNEGSDKGPATERTSQANVEDAVKTLLRSGMSKEELSRLVDNISEPSLESGDKKTQ